MQIIEKVNMTIEQIRSLFPHLDTDQVYFNHAAIGPWSKPVLDRIAEYSTQRSGGMVENFPFFLQKNASARTKLAKLLGAETSRLAWIDNVSNGLNILANGIDWQTGDRIILNDIEFPSNVYPFLNLQRLGVEIDMVKSRNGVVDVGDIENAITPKTKLVSISLVQFLSGYRADIDAIGSLCKEKGIIFCVDAIQATGVVEIDVAKSQIDFLCGGTQKWLMSSQGLSYIYLTEELQSRITQKNVGWASVNDAWNLLDYNLSLKSTAERFQNGTINVLGVCLFDASLDLFLGFGMNNVENRILKNTEHFIYQLVEIGIEPILKNVDTKNRAGIVSFKHERSNEIFEFLQGKRIYGAVRQGMIRFSPHFYNTKEEIDLVIKELSGYLK
ncbi:MAG: aminotransferase class V-fold PLP-dependent enzyme [Stygiobacter sp.]|nr:MAG: aminotransferase class V-fold PLP-dependent enzyme [Stygiobacter sp.]